MEGFFINTMKYSRLTKEQFEALHEEFINFLATQSITGEEWNKIKLEQPQVAEQELDVFSDLIWEGVLSKAAYLENISPTQLFLFHLGTSEMRLIVVKVTHPIDLTTSEGMQWLQEHVHDDAVEILQARKGYSEDKHKDIFELIRQGAVISEGGLFKSFDALIA